MLRALLLLVFGACAVRASDLISPPLGDGISNRVSQPHVTAELISETTDITLGKPFLVALHLHMDPGWHTYWINPGDAGLATTIKWTLPPGFTAGPIQWPTPEIHMMGPLTTYGYAGDVYLLTTITPLDLLAGYLPSRLDLKAHADWLVCQEECIPGKADLALNLNFNTGFAGAMDEEYTKFFAEARARLPIPNTRWDISAAYDHVGLKEVLALHFKNKDGVPSLPLGLLYFFPEQTNVLNPAETELKPISLSSDVLAPGFTLAAGLAQNGEKPAQISGVLVSDRPLIGNSKAVYLSAVPTNSNIPLNSASLSGSSSAQASASDAHRAPLQTELIPRQARDDGGAGIQAKPWLIAVLGAAFLGGMILNLMPCVLPVLSLKVFSLIRHAGENPGTAWKQGVAFTVGVVISFWVLAGLLIALRAAGNHLGWGFQMQSPGFVLALIFLFFLLGLNLFGVFELGTSLVGLDAKASGRVGSGLLSSFLNGALATLAATPCTAPFMGSSVGFAAEQPPFVALLVFTVLALGMAAPYLLLTIFPGALRFVPKPGAWMEAVRQIMGFLLLATVIFLIYVFGALVGSDQIPYLLALLLLASLAAWIYGRWGWVSPQNSIVVRFCSTFFLVLLIYIVAKEGVELAHTSQAKPRSDVISSDRESHGWQPWTPAAVDQALVQNRPVFVDFTAAWCLSCKVNEQVALETDAVRQAFAQKKVALFRADWTHSDPAISAVLEKYHRDGVPLYLLYSPAAKDSPQILPEVLTPGTVLEALRKLP